MNDQQQAFPLSWPAGWPRTARRDQQRARFSSRANRMNRRKTVAEAVRALDQELERLHAASIVLSTNLRVKLNGLPYGAQKEPDDTGAACYFAIEGKPVVLACDKWDAVADNIYAIAMHIDAMRGMDRWGVGNLDRAFTGYAALPPAGAQQTWWQVLGLTSDLAEMDKQAATSHIHIAYRGKARTAHPDAGGSDEAMSRLNVARDEGLRAIGAK
jgi:hypothetical protein